MTVSLIERHAALLARIDLLQSEAATLQREADQMQRALREHAAQQIRAIMAAHGMSTDDLMAHKLKPRQLRPEGYQSKHLRGPQPPRYRDPASGKTWAGFGRVPKWLANAPDRNAFRIELAA
jgi:DNA-binding protein H-NS